MFTRRYSMDLWTCRSVKYANHEKIWSANRKSEKCDICGGSANLTNYLFPQICRFAICGTFVRITHFYYFYKSKHSLPSFSTQKNFFLGCPFNVGNYLFSVLPMYYVHQNQILHRDLKSQNIFLTRQTKL